MIVVGDSGPLHYLILIDLIDLLPRLYGTVLIPPAVFSELTATSTPRKVARWVTHPPSWLQVQPVSHEAMRGVAGELAVDLDDGEREALALAEAVGADLVLMDDLAGRAEARRRALRVTGTLGILRVAAELGLVDVPLAVSKLQATNFYFDPALVRDVLGRWLGPVAGEP